MAPGRALGAPRRGRGRVPVRRSQPRGSPWAPCLRRAVEKGSEILARARKARPETTNGPGTALRGGGALGRPPGPSQPRRGAAGGEARGHPALRGQHPQPEPQREDAGTLPEPQGSADSGANPPLLRVAPLGLTEHRAQSGARAHPQPLRALLPPGTYIQAVEAGVHAPSHAELSSSSRPGGTRPFISSLPPPPAPGAAPAWLLPDGWHRGPASGRPLSAWGRLAGRSALRGGLSASGRVPPQGSRAAGVPPQPLAARGWGREAGQELQVPGISGLGGSGAPRAVRVLRRQWGEVEQ